MSMTQLSPKDIGSLRDEASSLVGQQIIIDNLRVPGNEQVKSHVIDTKDRIAIAISQVELFPYLIPGTKYHDRFHYDEGAQIIREAHETFAFQGQGGSPSVSIVMPGHDNAITVIKRVITHLGDELSWNALLQELGLEPSQFKDFTEVADGILTTRSNARIHLEKVPELLEESDQRIEHPNASVKNLDSVVKLSRDRRQYLKLILPDLL